VNPPRCHAIRLVNPFLGTLQLVHAGDVRALSRDGRHWEIQVRAQRPAAVAWGSLNRQTVPQRYYRYGFWNPDSGLRRMPVDPGLEPAPLRQAADRIIGLLREGLLEAMPFPLEDRYELWLLDQHHQPLALLGSTADRERFAEYRERRWQAVSAMQAIEDYSPREAQPMERLIRRQAGLRQWFRRGANGEGTGLKALCPAQLADRVLPSSRFPPLLVRDEWEDAQANALSREWGARLAPWLLQLPGLVGDRRRDLEQAAARQPRMVEAMHRLYPEVMDGRLLNTSRVAARIQQANG